MPMLPIAILSGIIPCNVAGSLDNSFIQIREDISDLSARDIIQSLLDTHCPTQEKVTKWVCKFIVKGDPLTKACYVESTAGYFFLSKDYLENTNIIYTRLD